MKERKEEVRGEDQVLTEKEGVRRIGEKGWRGRIRSCQLKDGKGESEEVIGEGKGREDQIRIKEMRKDEGRRGDDQCRRR